MARKGKDDFQNMFDSVVGENEGTEEKGLEKEVTQTTAPTSVNKESDALKKELLASKKKKFDDIYKRKTFPLKNDLYERLEKYLEGKPHGYQTKFAEYAITKALDELEDE